LKIVLDPGAFLPERAHEADAGLDLRVPMRAEGPILVPPHGRVTIDTGVHVEIPKGCVGFLKSKSGLMTKYGILTDGTVDEGYTGSVKVIAFNCSDEVHHFFNGDKISQLVIQKIEKPTLEVVDHLVDTERGADGFGSTGR